MSDTVPENPCNNSVIREATVADLASIVSLEHDAFPTNGYTYLVLRQLLEVSRHFFLVADNGAIIGYALGVLCPASPSIGWLLSIATQSAWRRTGVARNLACALIALLEDAGATELLGTVSPENLPSRRLWQALGFRELSTEADYFGPREDRIRLSRLVNRELS